MKYLIRTTILSVFLSTLFFTSSLTAEDTTSNLAPLKIGVVLGLTGFAAEHSDSIMRGLKLAESDLKAEGIEVNLNVQDDQTDPRKTALSFQYLASKDYKFIIGPTWSFQVQPAIPIIERSKMLAILPAGSSDINGGPNPRIFSMCNNRMQQAGPVSLKIKQLTLEKPIKPIIITPLGDWGEVHAKAYRKALIDAGITDIKQETFDFTSSFNDAKSIVLKAKQSNRNLILATGAASNMSDFFKANHQLRLNADMLLTQDFVDAVNSGLIVKPKQLNNIKIYISRHIAPKTTFLERFSKQDPPVYIYAARGYDSLILMAQAIKNGANDTTNAISYLNNLDSISGVTGDISFDKNGDSTAGKYQVIRYDW